MQIPFATERRVGDGRLERNPEDTMPHVERHSGDRSRGIPDRMTKPSGVRTILVINGPIASGKSTLARAVAIVRQATT